MVFSKAKALSDTTTILAFAVYLGTKSHKQGKCKERYASISIMEWVSLGSTCITIVQSRWDRDCCMGWVSLGSTGITIAQS